MSTYTEALAFAATYCSASERCISEVLEKTKRFELDGAEKARLIQRLQEEGFLNENRYARAFSNDKFRYNKWGRIKIRHMLRLKGLPETICEEALNALPSEEYQETLKNLISQKKKSLKGVEPYVAYARLMRFAAGRGFEPSLTASCLRKMGLDDES